MNLLTSLQPPVPASLPIYEIECEVLQLFRSLVYFILLSVRKVSYGER